VLYPTAEENGHDTAGVTGNFRQIAVDFDFITPIRRYLIEDFISGVNIELEFVDGVPADAAVTPVDGTIATAKCTNQLPTLVNGSSRHGDVKCFVAAEGFSLTRRPRTRRQNYAEGGRPGYTIGTRTWVVTMLQIPGEHTITEAERLEVGHAGTSFPHPTLYILQLGSQARLVKPLKLHAPTVMSK
jgi:hypothetical protein